MSTTILTAISDIQFERTIPASDLGPKFKFNPDRFEEVGIHDSFDASGESVTAEMPATADLKNAYPNDIFKGVDGLTHVWRGRYWVIDISPGGDGTPVALLRLGQNVRCSVVPWCEGHDILDVDGSDHFGGIPFFQSNFAGIAAEVWYSMKGSGPVKTKLTFASSSDEMTLTRRSAGQLAAELRGFADKLLETAACAAHSAP